MTGARTTKALVGRGLVEFDYEPGRVSHVARLTRAGEAAAGRLLDFTSPIQ